MKAQLPRPEHYSYNVHRRQVVSQVILPVILASLLVIAAVVLISIATFRGGAEVSRWGAIATIWIMIPLMIIGLISIVLHIAIGYLLARLLGILPTYTGLAQGYAYRIRGYVVHYADLAAKPIIGFAGFVERVKAFVGRV